MFRRSVLWVVFERKLITLKTYDFETVAMATFRTIFVCKMFFLQRRAVGQGGSTDDYQVYVCHLGHVVQMSACG